MKSNFNWRFMGYYITYLSFISCEVEQSHTIKHVDWYEEKIVVHGFISIPGGVNINVQKSSAFNRHRNTQVEISEILLYRNNNPWLNLLPLDSCTYVSSENVSYSHVDSYKLYLKTADGVEIISEAQNIPPMPRFDTVRFTPNVYGYLNEIYYEFTDVDENTQYYYIKVIQYIDSVEFDNKPPLFSSEQILHDTNKPIEKFSGRIKIPYYDVKVNKIEVRLYALSESIVKFLISLSENAYLQDEAYAENIYPLYSNITNGFGVFGAYAYSSKYFKVKPRNP